MRRNYGEPLGSGPQTNQRAELKAVLKALQTIPTTQNLLIETDSTYTILCVTEWYYKWEWKSWRKVKGEPLKNLELIKPSVRLLEQRKAIGSATYFRWVKGHAGNPGNEAADKLAGAGARYGSRVFYVPPDPSLNTCDIGANTYDFTANLRRRRGGRDVPCARLRSVGRWCDTQMEPRPSSRIHKTRIITRKGRRRREKEKLSG